MDLAPLPSPRNFDFRLGSFTAGPATILWNRLAAAAATIIVAGLLYLFLQRTRPGKHIRAVTDNRAAAELMGIPSSRVLALTFGIGSMVGMLGLSVLIGLPFTLTGRRHVEIHRKLRLTAGAGSAAYGFFLIGSTGIVQGILHHL